MKILISWSGSTSQAVAQALKEWIPGPINAAEPWLSSSDIAAGARWAAELAEQLQDTHFGVTCLTPDNLGSLWIQFEAGALSKTIDRSRVVPYLTRIRPAEIQGPLSVFQAVNADKDGTRKLVNSINRAVKQDGEKEVDQGTLDKSFELWWPELEAKLKNLPQASSEEGVARSDREILEEILLLARDANRTSRGETVERVLNAAMVNTLLDALYRRAVDKARNLGASQPAPPPTFSSGDLSVMDPDYLGGLLDYYFRLSIGASGNQ